MVNLQRGVMRALRIANHPVTVTEIVDHTPWYRRVSFSAPEFVSQLEVFPTLWLRLWVPDPAKEQGFVGQRGYTVSTIRPEEGIFTLDFILHGSSGPASDWAKRCRVGDCTEVSLTPVKIALPDDASRVLLAGDITALPAINTWLRAIPSDVPVTVAIEDDHDDTEKLPKVPRDNTDWLWVEPGPTRGGTLAETVGAVESAAEGLYTWAAGEKTLVKTLRPVLRQTLGLDRAHHFTQFYWIEGKATA